VRDQVAVGQSEDVARRNMASIMRVMLSGGSMARAQIAEVTGLSAGTVTRLTSRLTASGVLRELPAVLRPADAGRPRVPLDLSGTRGVIGVHIGLLRTTIGLVDLRGHTVAERTLPRDSRDPHVILAQTVAATAMLAREADRRVCGVGVSIGGWVESDSGTVLEHPALGWRDVPLSAMLGSELAGPLRLDSVVRAMALAESWFGVGKDAGSIVELFIGNVVGSALVLGGAIHRGKDGGAGTITHLQLTGAKGAACSCGRRTCLQAVVTDEAVMTLARKQGAATGEDGIHDLIARARDGNRTAASLLRTRAAYAGQTAAILLDMINPDLIVLAGDGLLAAPEYLPAARRELAARSQFGSRAAARLLPSELGAHALVRSSAALFLDAYYADPLRYEKEAS
jgi:predicted NBD/HSP70 family sugar kinase